MTPLQFFACCDVIYMKALQVSKDPLRESSVGAP
jgi:hypothetical protein